jgi:RHS repeat-associated protein
MSALARTRNRDYYTRAANEDCFNGGPRTRTKYVYNALGQRIEKSGANGVSLFSYDEAGHLLGEYTATGALIEETVWLGDTPVATLMPSGASVAVYYIHSNHLNAPTIITRPSDNAQMWRWDQDPFGTSVANSNPQGIGTFVYNPRFPGQYYDVETGLNYNYFRDYDPLVGRYTESDPLGLGGGINSYAYAGGAPVIYVDPSGQCPWCVVVIGGIVGGLAQGITTTINGGTFGQVAEATGVGFLEGAALTLGAITGADIAWAGAATTIEGTSAAGALAGEVGGLGLGAGIHSIEVGHTIEGKGAASDSPGGSTNSSIGNGDSAGGARSSNGSANGGSGAVNGNGGGCP